MPGIEALGRRRQSLEEQIKGTALDTQKTRQHSPHRASACGRLRQGRQDVRSAILEMFNDISSALEEGDEAWGR